MTARQCSAIMFVVIALLVLGCAAKHETDSQDKSGVAGGKGPVKISQVDWVLLNARVDLLTDTFMNRWPRVVSPPVYTLNSKGQHVIASAYIDSPWLQRVSNSELQETLNDAGNVFCNEIYLPLPTSDSVQIQLAQDSISCSVDFFTLTSVQNNVQASKDVATYDFQRKQLTLRRP